MIYDPQEDSYLLEECVKKHAKGKVLDMGTGSGIQAKAALKNTSDILAADINLEAVESCQKQKINTIQSDLFSNIKDSFDTIIFNPPYLPKEELEDKESQQTTTGGKQGHEILEKFLSQAREHLNKDGIILIVCSSLTGDVEKIFIKYNYKFTTLKKEKHFFEELKVYLLNSISILN